MTILESSTPILAGRGLTKSYCQTEVLHHVDFEIAPGETVAIMGKSGSGKSTLLHLLAGLLRPDAGEVYFQGSRIDSLSEPARSSLRLANMGFVFQFGDLVPELTVRENVELPLRLLGVPAKEARVQAAAMLDRLGIGQRGEKLLSKVSGGQAQRAAVARALIHRPAVVFADEPTGALDQASGELVLEELLAAARDQQTAVVLVTHELSVAAWASRDIELVDGAIANSGSLPEVPPNEHTRTAGVANTQPQAGTR